MEDLKPELQRFRLALALFELSETLLRQKLRRQQPEATEAEIDVLLTAWRQRRPGAALGDSPGRPRPWPPS